MKILQIIIFALGLAAAAPVLAQQGGPFAGRQDVVVTNTPDVVIRNTDQEAVPVYSADGERFQVQVDVRIEGTASFAEVPLAIPAGKRILIDHVTADVRLPENERGYLRLSFGPHATQLTGQRAAPFVGHIVPLQDAGGKISVGGGYRTWLAGQQVSLWADSYASVMLVRGWDADSPVGRFSQNAFARVSLSGRIVDQPLP